MCMVAAAVSCAELPVRRSPSLLLLAFFLTACGSQPEPTPTPFDFYVLAISWSPSYCAAEGASANRRQCEARPPHGFVVHGLWPQHEQGWPEFCAPGSEEWVADELARSMLDIMPSSGLVGHQWRKHGSCSGLSQEDYFALTRAAFERIALPDPAPLTPLVDPVRLATMVRSANEGLEEGQMAVTCDATYLREIRICMTGNLDFRACPEVAARACVLDQARMPSP